MESHDRVTVRVEVQVGLGCVMVTAWAGVEVR